MRYSLNLHKSNMIGLGIVYIYIPILLFIICWIKLPLAILACIIITKALRIFIQSIKSEESDDVIKINIIFGVFIFITIFAIGFVCGWVLLRKIFISILACKWNVLFKHY